MTCDDTSTSTTDVCPGTELTCNCSVDSPGLVWNLPGSETIPLDDKVDSERTAASGIFFAVITNNNTGVLESMLIYTATVSLVNATIVCKELGGMGRSASATITYIFAG